MSSPQERTLALCESATPHNKLKTWFRGYIPEHYKRLNIDMDEARELALKGVAVVNASFGEMTYFTQSLIVGACLFSKYKTITIVTTSQYGKSWTISMVAILLAKLQKKDVNIVAGKDDITKVIMKNVLSHLQSADDSIKKSLLEYRDKIDKLNSSVTKESLSFVSGGSISSGTLGSTSSDHKKSSSAIGRGGVYIHDEASLTSDDAFAEIGRRDFSNVDGERELLVQISNPHQKGQFYDKLVEENPPKDSLIIWMDVRTVLEEGRIPSIERVKESDFFKNDSTCQRYFLCELETDGDTSMFKNIQYKDIDSLMELQGFKWFIGLDSAYKGKDSIILTLTGINDMGQVLVADMYEMNKGKKWIDGVTSEYIIKSVLKVIDQFGVRMVCVDVGYGVWLVEGLAKHSYSHGFRVVGINFGAGTTPDRKKMSHFSAKYGSNMRAELHLDLQELMTSRKIWFTTPIAKILAPQMAAVRSINKSGGKIGIIPKDEIKHIIKHSPDELDSTLLSVHALLLYILNVGNDLPVYDKNYTNKVDNPNVKEQLS